MPELLLSLYCDSDRYTKATMEVALALVNSHGISYAAIFISEHREAIVRAAESCSSCGAVTPVLDPAQAVVA
jgi:hypothetical protein